MTEPASPHHSQAPFQRPAQRRPRQPFALLALLALICWTGLGLHAATPAEDRAYKVAARLFQDNAYGLAEREFGEFLTKFPESKLLPDVVLLQAQCRYHLKRLDEAIAILIQHRPTAGPLTDQYLFWIAESHYQASRLTEAASGYAELLRDHPQTSRKLDAALGEAFARYRLKQPTEVRNLLEREDGPFMSFAKATPGDPKVVRGRLLLAETLLSVTNGAAAAQALRSIPESGIPAPLLWERHFLTGKASLLTTNPAAGLAAITNLAALRPPDATAPYRLTSLQGELLAATGALDEAIRILQANLATNAPATFRREALARTTDLTLRQNKVQESLVRTEQLLADTSWTTADQELLSVTLGELRLRQYLGLTAAERTAATNLLSSAKLNLYPSATNTITPLRAQAAYSLGWVLWEEFNASRQTNRLTESLGLFEAAAAGLPPSLDRTLARFKLGDIHFALGNYPAALTNYQRVAQTAPSRSPDDTRLAEHALFQNVRAATEAGNQAAAAAAMETLLTAYPSGAFAERSFLVLGQGLRRLDRPGDARELFSRFVNQFTNSTLLPEVQLALAQTYVQEGQWSQAAQHYERWLNTHANHGARSRAEFDRAWIEAQAGNLTNAQTLFTNFIAHFPTNSLAPLAQNWVADFHFNAGAYLRAEENYQLLYKNTNWSQTALAHRANLMAGRAAFARGSPKDARVYFTELINNLPSTTTNDTAEIQAEGWILLGDVILTQFLADPTRPAVTFSEAVTAFNRVAQSSVTNRFNPVAWGRLGDCYLQAGNTQPAQLDNALQAYTNALTAATATTDTRCLAGIGLGKVLEKKAELATPTERPPLLQEALRQYLGVLNGKYLREGETLDPLWAKEAGLAAARIAEDSRDTQVARGIYRRLAQLLPVLKAGFEQKLEQLERAP